MSGSASAPTICVLGCGGFIGSHLLDRLLAAGHFRVIGIDRAPAKITHNLGNPSFTYVNADVYDTATLARWVSRSDVVVSLVALCNPSYYNTIPVDVIEVNFTHPVAVARMCQEAGKWLVHFSTSEVYGKTVPHLIDHRSDLADHPEYHRLNEEETPLVLGPVCAQRWSYACAKQLAERMIYALGFQRGLAYTIVRPFNFIGPRMDYIPGVDGEGIPRVLACFMEALMREQPLKLVDAGRSRRTFTYIDDAIDAVMAILASPKAAAGRTFNIGNPANEGTIADLAALMIRLYAEARPESAGRHTTQVVSGVEFYGKGYEDSDRRVPDISAAEELLHWHPVTRLDEALRRTIAAYLDTYSDAIAARPAR
jgi:UDP-apiose/xylose synthase